MKLALSALTLAIGLGTGFAAFAAGESHLHEGDVLPLLVDGQIVLDDLDDKEVDFATGYPIFGAAFGDLARGPHSTVHTCDDDESD